MMSTRSPACKYSGEAMISTSCFLVCDGAVVRKTVSGMVSLWGTETDSDGTLVEGKFSVDSEQIVTFFNSTGTYRTSWNSATVANGWHVLEFRATDNGVNDGRATIKVFVNN